MPSRPKSVCKLPRPEDRGISPMMGFQPPTCDRPRRGARTAFSERGLFCAHSGTLDGDCVRRGAGPWRGTVSSDGTRWAGSHRFNSRWPRPRLFRGHRTRLGGTAASAPSFGTSPGRSVRGTPTGAPLGRHVWPPRSTTKNTRMNHNTFRGETSPPTDGSWITERTRFRHALKAVGSALRFV
jgi:hypothetical protein